MAASPSMDHTAFLQALCSSMGAKEIGPGVLEALKYIAMDEYDAVTEVAGKLMDPSASASSSSTVPLISAEAIRAACRLQQIAAPPLRDHNIEHARVYNQRSIAWPLGSAVRIPLDQVVTHFGEFAALPRAVDPAVADVSVTPATSSSAVSAAAGVSSSSTREAASGSMDVETRDSSTVSSDAAASAAPSSRPVLAPISLSISKPATSAAGKDHSALPPVFMA